MTYDIIPLFSKVFYKNQLDVDVKKYVSLIENKFQNSGTNSPTDVDNIALTSSSRFVLDAQKFVDLKNIIMKEFNNFSRDIMHFQNDFQMTTSWFTKSHKNQSSNYHNHNNCMYSGILYLQTDCNSGDISFENYNDQRYRLNVNEYNIYNSKEWQFKPIDGLIIIFPSEVHHKILKNNSDIVRHSVAFNFAPVGKLGYGDSFMNVEIINE